MTALTFLSASKYGSTATVAGDDIGVDGTEMKARTASRISLLEHGMNGCGDINPIPVSTTKALADDTAILESTYYIGSVMIII